jgi:hypothetical protein
MQYQDCVLEAQDEAADSDNAMSAGQALCDARLAEANINPQTGLATDYLNHFNEAIMLLEMAGNSPDCLADFQDWQPMGYREHFLESRLKDRDLAIAAYVAADPAARACLDTLAGTMITVIESTRSTISGDVPAQAAGIVSERAAKWLKKLVVRAGAVINGDIDLREIEAPQLTADRVTRRV